MAWEIIDRFRGHSSSFALSFASHLRSVAPILCPLKVHPLRLGPIGNNETENAWCRMGPHDEWAALFRQARRRDRLGASPWPTSRSEMMRRVRWCTRSPSSLLEERHSVADPALPLVEVGDQLSSPQCPHLPP